MKVSIFIFVNEETIIFFQDAETSGTQEKIIIGAASKGIIDREYRHNAQIYRQLYQPNPFASETDEDIQKYIKEVETRKPEQSPAPGSARDTSFGELEFYFVN